MFVDSHCHLDTLEEEGMDLQDVLLHAKNAGVGRVVTIGTKMSECDRLAKIAARFPEVYYSIATHPHEAAQEAEQITADGILKRLGAPKLIGIGEAGLDYFYDFAPREDQIRIFRAHVRAALESGLPLSIHTREAEEDTIKVIEEEGGASGRLKGIIHCFSSKPLLARKALEWGFMISFSGILTFKKSEEVRAVAAEVPFDRLLVETDSPYLAPIPFRGKPCQPAYVVNTAKVLAEVKGVSLAEIERCTTENFFRLYPGVAQ